MSERRSLALFSNRAEVAISLGYDLIDAHNFWLRIFCSIDRKVACRVILLLRAYRHLGLTLYVPTVADEMMHRIIICRPAGGAFYAADK